MPHVFKTFDEYQSHILSIHLAFVIICDIAWSFAEAQQEKVCEKSCGRHLIRNVVLMCHKFRDECRRIVANIPFVKISTN